MPKSASACAFQHCDAFSDFIGKVREQKTAPLHVREIEIACQQHRWEVGLCNTAMLFEGVLLLYMFADIFDSSFASMMKKSPIACASLSLARGWAVAMVDMQRQLAPWRAKAKILHLSPGLIPHAERNIVSSQQIQ